MHTIKRFLKYVNITSTCWLWTASTKNGYGRCGQEPAHRVSWTLFNGTIPKGYCVLHYCDVRNCVNPSHLWLGTYKDNNQDCLAKGRRDLTSFQKAGTDSRRKLLTYDIIAIKEDLKCGVKGKDIAVKFGVCASLISQIKHRKKYSEV